MRHVVLLGDSIFDNGLYVPGYPDVVAQLQSRLPDRWVATLLAKDGDVTLDVFRQLADIPANATDLVLSVGGNDALGHSYLMDRRAYDGKSVLRQFAAAVAAFADDYRALAAALADQERAGRSVSVCTIYNGNTEYGPAANAAIAMFNDVIMRRAQYYSWPVIELRDVFTTPADYANPIEPSVIGGSKLAYAIISNTITLMEHAPFPMLAAS